MPRDPATLYNDLDDGIITGAVHSRRTKCPACGQTTRVIRIAQIQLPDGIKPSNHLIPYKAEGATTGPSSDAKIVAHQFLGLNCGCYAAFHRQISKIKTLREVGGKK